MPDNTPNEVPNELYIKLFALISNIKNGFPSMENITEIIKVVKEHDNKTH